MVDRGLIGERYRFLDKLLAAATSAHWNACLEQRLFAAKT